MWEHSNKYDVNNFIASSYAVNEHFLFEIRLLFLQKMGLNSPSLLRKVLATLRGKTVPGPCDLKAIPGNVLHMKPQ